MKKIILILLSLAFISCEEEDVCDCTYINYENGLEVYRSTWDASCENEVLSQSQYTAYDGTITYMKTVISCK